MPSPRETILAALPATAPTTTGTTPKTHTFQSGNWSLPSMAIDPATLREAAKDVRDFSGSE